MEKNKSKFCFVILQYGAYFATSQCIDSILRNCDDSVDIVIVDNCSPDDSYDRLIKEFGKHKLITILKSDSNLGFANGNNIGIEYAYKNLHPDFIVVLNNDTELLDDSFQFLVEKEYLNSNFYVLGPMILSGDGKYTSSPIRKEPWEINDIKKCIRIEQAFLNLTRFKLGWLYKLFMGLKNINCKKRKVNNNTYLGRQENCELHGSFLILSKDYLNEYSGFDSRTFMYCEESILFYKLLRDKKKTVYNPQIRIYHAEDVATNNSYRKSDRQQIFYLSNHINSCKILLEIIEGSVK